VVAACCVLLSDLVGGSGVLSTSGEVTDALSLSEGPKEEEVSDGF
jgi:hypothetical protein